MSIATANCCLPTETFFCPSDTVAVQSQSQTSLNRYISANRIKVDSKLDIISSNNHCAGKESNRTIITFTILMTYFVSSGLSDCVIIEIY